MVRFLEVTFPDGDVYRVPVDVLACDHARHYAASFNGGDYEASLAESRAMFEDDDTAIEWARGDMIWRDVQKHAHLVRKQTTIVPRGDAWCNARMVVVVDEATSVQTLVESDSSLALDAYQAEAKRTARTTTDLSRDLSILALGVAGEAGEVADYVKKVVGHGHALDVDVLARELGDVLWYVAILSDRIGLTLADVAARNIDKLRARYPDGFDEQRSRERAE